MKCERFEERYDRLDEGSALPASLALHLARCPLCAARLEMRRRALELYRMPGPEGVPDIVDRVMAVLPFLPRPRREISLRNWVISGLFLASSVVLVPAQNVFSRVIDHYGPQWMVPFVLVFGFSVAIFGCFFIVTHMDAISARMGITGGHAPR